MFSTTFSTAVTTEILVSIVQYLPIDDHASFAHTFSDIYRLPEKKQMDLGIKPKYLAANEENILYDLSLLEHFNSMWVSAIFNEMSRPDRAIQIILSNPSTRYFDSAIRGLIGSKQWDYETRDDCPYYLATSFVAYMDGIIHDDDYDEEEIIAFNGWELMEACHIDYVLYKYSWYHRDYPLHDYHNIVHGRTKKQMIELIGRPDEADKHFDKKDK